MSCQANSSRRRRDMPTLGDGFFPPFGYLADRNGFLVLSQVNYACSLAMALVFEGDFDLGAIELNLAVAQNHVLRHDFRYAQLAQMFSCLLDHVLGGVFPAFGAGADEFDNVVNALGWVTL